MRIINVLGHSFSPELASRARVALDCGANEGRFAAWLSAHTDATIYSFEPDPRLFANLPPLPRVEYVPQALDGHSGSVDLALNRRMCSSAVIHTAYDDIVTVPATSLDDFCTARGLTAIDFMKVDIEGSELSMIEQTPDARLATIGQLTIEFHDMFRPEHLPRIRAIVDRLAGLGFFHVRFTQFTWGDCLFINRQWAALSAIDKLQVVAAGKYAPGIRRLARRMVGKPPLTTE